MVEGPTVFSGATGTPKAAQVVSTVESADAHSGSPGGLLSRSRLGSGGPVVPLFAPSSRVGRPLLQRRSWELNEGRRGVLHLQMFFSSQAIPSRCLSCGCTGTGTPLPMGSEKSLAARDVAQ